MKIICLNIWGGRAGKEGVISFFEKYRDVADIFCLQEVWADKYEKLEGLKAGGVVISNKDIMTYALREISEVLPDHEPYFHPSYLQNYGLATFVRKTIPVIEDGDVFVHYERGYIPQGDVGKHARNIQYVTIELNGEQRSILNFHGLWNGNGKGDCPERLEQSDRITDFIKGVKDPFILLGDFNLTPDTESLKKIENIGLRNLISEYNITSTRTSLYTKPEGYADYVFVSPEIEVNECKVLPDEISDHAAIFLDIA